MNIENKIVGESLRIKRERKTIEKMIHLYCLENHNYHYGLCEDCIALYEYAYRRLINCPFRENKPVCSDCTVHCYKTDMRERIRQIMRYSGPKLLLKHPYLVIMHLIDEKFRK